MTATELEAVTQARDITIHGATFTERQFIPPTGDVEPAHRRIIAGQVNGVGRNAQWWLGDMLCWLEDTTDGGEWRLYADITGLGKTAVSQSRLVAKAFKPEQRRWHVPWHYYETSSHVLDLSARERLMDTAAEDLPSRDEFRRMCDKARAPEPSPTTTTTGADDSVTVPVRDTVVMTLFCEPGSGPQVRNDIPPFLERLMDDLEAGGLPVLEVNVQ